MICPLIGEAFRPYGRVEQSQTEPAGPERDIPLERRERMDLYRFDRETSWDYRSGMTALAVQDGAEQKLFYLDRSVTIAPGVCFGFFPLGERSVIAGDPALWAGASPVDTVAVPRGTTEARPLEVFTLFRQEGIGGLYFRGERHPPMELVYVEKGQLHNYCGGWDILLRPKEYLLFGPNEWHMQYADEDVRFLTISFTWEGQDLSPYAGRSFPASVEMQRTIRALLGEHDQRSEGWEEAVNALTKLLLLQVLRRPGPADRQRKASPVSEEVRRQTVDRAMQTVSARIREKWTVPKLASAVNVSASQLTELFQSYLGISPARYITRVRVEESKALLAGGRMSVGEVAEHLGYSNIQHFSRQFHEWVGCSPTAYARTARQKTP